MVEGKVSDSVEIFKAQLKSSLVAAGTPPSIAGHGVLWPGVWRESPAIDRPVCTRQRQVPGIAARAYLVLVLLGKASPDNPNASVLGDRAERYVASEWVDWSYSWIEQHAAELRDRLDAAGAAALTVLDPDERVRPMLEVMRDLALSSPHLTATQRAIVSVEWYARAEYRVQNLLRRRKGALQRMALEPPGTPALTAANSPRWKKAAEILQRDDLAAAALLGAYSLHVFHAALGIPQIALHDASKPGKKKAGDAGDGRATLYAALLGLLKYSCPAGGMHRCAQMITTAWEQMPLFGGTSEAGGKDEEPEPLVTSARIAGIPFAELPTCFSPHDGTGPVDLADVASQVGSERALDRLAQAHHLGEMLADQAIDILRLRHDPTAGPGFDLRCAEYLKSRVRRATGRQRAAKKRRLEARSPDAGAAAAAAAANDPPEPTAEHPFAKNLRNYFEYVLNGKLQMLIRLHVGDVHEARWEPCGSAREPSRRPCAMCHVHATAGVEP